MKVDILVSNNTTTVIFTICITIIFVTLVITFGIVEYKKLELGIVDKSLITIKP